jgi:hypothetical protein
MISDQEADLAQRLRTAVHMFSRNSMDAVNGLGAFKQMLTDGYAVVKMQISREGNLQVIPYISAVEPLVCLEPSQIQSETPVLEAKVEESVVEEEVKPKRKRKPE